MIGQLSQDFNWKFVNTIGKFLSERVENGKALPSVMDAEGIEHLKTKDGMTPEKVSKIMEIMSGQHGMTTDFGYYISPAYDGKIFENTPEIRKTITGLSDEELAEKRKAHAELAEEAKKNNEKNAGKLAHQLEEIDLEVQRRAYEKADPNHVMAISEDREKLWDVCAERDKLTRF